MVRGFAGEITDPAVGYFFPRFSKGMAERGKGAIVLMSSGAGIVGSPYIQTYSATKAYIFTLAEALWGELQPLGIDVLSILPGNTIGQSFKDVDPSTPGFQTGAQVVEDGLKKLGIDPVVLTGGTFDMYKDFYNIDVRKGFIMAMKQQMDAIRAAYGRGAETEEIPKE